MGTIYKIKCSHCGAEFMHNVGSDYGVLCACTTCECHVETESAIRCPSCLRRLNRTEEEFNKQVQTVLLWD